MSAKPKIFRTFANLRSHLEWGGSRSPSSPSISSSCFSSSGEEHPHPDSCASYKRGLVGGVAVVMGLLLAAAPASALSKHVFSTSFAGPTFALLSNPTSVAVDQQTHDLYVTNSPVNEQQAVTVEATGGTYTLTFKGQTTRPISASEPIGGLEEALNGLTTIEGSAPGDPRVRVFETETAGHYTIEFSGTLGGAPQPQLIADPSHLLGTTHTVAVTTARPASSVADVEKFTPAGEFLLIFGRQVNRAATELVSEREANHETPSPAELQAENVCHAGESCKPGSLGATPGSFTDPAYLALDNSGVPGRQGDVYVGDSATGEGSGNVQKFDPAGNLIAQWGGGGLLDGSGDGDGNSFAGNSFGEGLRGIAVDPSGNLFVFSARRFFKFAPDGGFIADFPTPQNRFAAVSLAADSADNLYYVSRVPDITQPPQFSHLNNPGRVAKITSSGLFLADLAIGLPGELAEFTDLGIDPSTPDLYLTLNSGQVEHYLGSCEPTPASSCLPFDTFGEGHLTQPEGLAVDSATGTVYVADTGDHSLAVFAPVPYLPDVAASAEPLTPATARLRGHVDPAAAGEVTSCRFQYVPDSASSANDVQTLTLAGATGGAYTLTANTATATATLQTGSSSVQFATLTGALYQGDSISAPGISPNTTITSIVTGNGSGELELSAPATLSGRARLLTSTETTPAIEYDATAATIQESLESLPGIAAGNVAVSGPSGGPYTIEFKAALADTRFPQLTADSSALTPPGATLIPTTANEGGAWGNATTLPCDESHISSPTDVSAEPTGLTYGSAYHYRLIAENANGPSITFDQTFESLPLAPEIGELSLTAVHADTARIHAQLNPNGGDGTYHTTYYFDYVTQQQFEANEWADATSTPELDAGSARTLQNLTADLAGLKPNTTYRFRLLARNATATTAQTGPSFTTLPFVSEPSEPCPNAHLRQQTSAAQLLDCRAYELVSAPDTGGYDVESDLVSGQTPYPGYSEAHSPSRVLYAVHGGGIPGAGHPTNRGADPYIATRTNDDWSTEYVGVPADNPFAAKPFSSIPSGASAGLDTFAFGGPEGCSPCFGPGAIETGIPLRLPSGELIQGMVPAKGTSPSPSALPDGYIAADLSANGEHLIFGSTSAFASGANNETGDVSIYDHNLISGETHVISNAPGSEDFPTPLPCLQGEGECHSPGDTNGISELAISKDGSHILLGQKVSTDADGNVYWHLYMEAGDAVSSIALTPGTTGATGGVLFDGMTADGSKVFFSSEEHLTEEDESHTGADIFMWSQKGREEGHPLTLISKGEGSSCDPVANSVHPHWNVVNPTEENCGALAIGGGGVSSANGALYFLSPERLAGNSNGSVQNAPNLYVARPGDGYQTHYVTTLESILNAPHPPKLRRTFDHSLTTTFANATAVASEHQHGDFYVLDSGANTIEKFDSSGNPANFSFPAGSKEAPGNQLKGADTPAGSFSELFFGFLPLPTQLAVDQSNGDLYVPDFNHGVVDKFSSSGEYLSQIGGLEDPSGLAVDPANGDLYVTSLLEGAVRVFSPSGNPISQFSTAEGALPAAIAVDAAGTAYVTRFGGATDVYDPAGKFVKALDPNPTESVALDPSTGDLYVDEGERIARYDSSGNRIEALDLPAPAHLSGSVGLAIDPEGNLYATTAQGTEVSLFKAALAPDPHIDNPLVLDSVSPQTRHTADFQTTPEGDFATFPSTLALAGQGEQTAGHTVLYRYDAPAEVLACVSCSPTGFRSEGDSHLAFNGLSLTDEGRVFFNSTDRLAATDTDNRQDVYEWEPLGVGNCQSQSTAFSKFIDSCLALVSAGTSTFDSSLLTATADATDAHFFTRDSLAPQDKNGPTMKIYDAREGGGFPYLFPPVGCQASDECHGASSPAPGPLPVGSATVIPPPRKPKPCKKGFVLKRGKCVKKHRHNHQRRATHKHGGGR